MAVFFFIIFVILSPYSSQITSMYQTTQSGWYSTAITALNTLQSVSGNALAQLIPGVSGANQIIGSIKDFMNNARQTISILYTLMTITIPAIVISIIMLIAGIAIAKRSGHNTAHVAEKDSKGKHCEHCGAKVSKGDKFCGGCGKKP